MKKFDLERIKQIGSKVKLYKNQIKATITALVLGATTGCGYTATVPSYNGNNSDENVSSIELSMEEIETTIETPIETTIAEFIQATTGSKQPATYKNPQYITESEKVTTKVEQNETSKVTTVTTANNKNNSTVTSTNKVTNNSGNSNNTTTNSKTEGTTNSTQPNTQAPTEEQTQSNTQRPTQSTTQSTTKKPVQTTTQVTTKAPVTTTTTTTPAPVQQSYSLQDITNNADAFEYYADKLNMQLLKGSLISTSNGYTDGNVGSKIALLMLNSGYVAEDVIRDVFSNYSKDEIQTELIYLSSTMTIQKLNGNRVDFSKYTIDSDLANKLNYVQDETLSVLNGGDNTNLITLMNAFFYTGEYEQKYLDSVPYNLYMYGCYINGIGFDETIMSMESVIQTDYIDPFAQNIYNVTYGYSMLK